MMILNLIDDNHSSADVDADCWCWPAHDETSPDDDDEMMNVVLMNMGMMK